MWIEQARLRQIDSAAQTGQSEEIDRVLADLLSSGSEPQAVPRACPACGRDLVRQPLPDLGLFVSACPGDDGAWIAGDAAATLRALAATSRRQAARQ